MPVTLPTFKALSVRLLRKDIGDESVREEN